MESNEKNFRFIVREYDWSSLKRNFAWVCLGTVFEGRRRTLCNTDGHMVGQNIFSENNSLASILVKISILSPIHRYWNFH